MLLGSMVISIRDFSIESMRHPSVKLD